MANRVTFVSGGAAVAVPGMLDALDETPQQVFSEGTRGLRGLVLTNSGNALAYAKLFFVDAAPTVASAVPDVVIGVPANATVDVDLHGLIVGPLFMAATAESGAGATAPNADIVGSLLW